MAATNQATKSRQWSNEKLVSQAAESVRQPAEDVVNYLRDYAKENPETAALWCFGIGFVLGWKLKPW